MTREIIKTVANSKSSLANARYLFKKLGKENQFAYSSKTSTRFDDHLGKCLQDDIIAMIKVEQCECFQTGWSATHTRYGVHVETAQYALK